MHPFRSGIVMQMKRLNKKQKQFFLLVSTVFGKGYMNNTSFSVTSTSKSITILLLLFSFVFSSSFFHFGALSFLVNVFFWFVSSFLSFFSTSISNY